jgi:hypothetical protein
VEPLKSGVSKEIPESLESSFETQTYVCSSG